MEEKEVEEVEWGGGMEKEEEWRRRKRRMRDIESKET